MEKETKYPLELISRFLQNRASLEEKEILLKWRNENAEHENYFNEIAKIYLITKKENYDTQFSPNVELAWQKVQSKIEANKQKEIHQKKIVELKLYPWWSIAASILLIIGLGFYAFKKWDLNETYISIHSGEHHKVVYLPDSSKVWIKAHSSIKYPSTFNNNNRLVKLDGDAFFEVRKRNGMPFIIKANYSQTEVLGTSFLIKSNAKLAIEEIEVSSGKVKYSELKNNKNYVILTPNEKAVLGKNKDIVKTKLMHSNSLFWKNQVLKFENESIASIIKTLSEFYNKEIELKNSSLGTCKFTGSFDHSSLEETLQIIALAVNAETEKVNNIYYLKGESCNQ